MEKLRSEIEEQYKWDLTTIFKTDEDWQKEYNKLKKDILVLKKYKGIIMSNANTLYSLVKDYFSLSRRLEKVYVYTSLNSDAETSNTKYQELNGIATNLYQDFSVITSYIEPEILKSEYSLIEKYMEEVKELKEYKNYFNEIFRYKNHYLTPNEEEILSNLSTSLQVAQDAYEKLTDTDLKLGVIKDEDLKEVELTDSNYHKYISSKDRRVRKEAFNAMYSGYKSIKNTVASTMYGEVKTNVSLAKIRKYNSALEASLMGDNVTKDIYNNLISTVSSNLNVLYKYYDLRKKVLKLDELHLYDIYADLIEDVKKEYTFEEAKEIVLNALAPLGKEYVKDATKAFTDRWIDIYPNHTKRSGAYSGGCYDTNPFMLLNFDGSLNDVSTLAHELGHSMHSYYSHKNNDYQNGDYKIFVAEVASTVNELLVCNYLLKESNDKKVKLSILNRLLELIKGTIFRQTMFAEFEKDIYDMVENGEVLTHDNLSDKYYELNKKYFGSSCVVDDDIKYEWARIPHFYYNFYVYKYATSLSAACYIVDNILSGKDNALEGYLEFLKQGGRDYPLNELLIAGVDMTKKDVIESAIKMFDNIIEEFNNEI